MQASQTFTLFDVAPALKPPLKWAGGKRWIVPHLAPIWNLHQGKRLVEPFCGGLAVTLGLAPDHALLNDINPHAINFYNWLRRGLLVTIPMRNEQLLYYTHRTRFNTLIAAGGADTAEAASLFYYLNRTGFNGLCRFNRKGEFNVPFGKYAKINYTKDFSVYSQVLSRWQFSSVDFGSVDLAADDLIYADPPYDVQFTNYSKEGFNWDDQVRLAEWLARHRGPVVLSNQATDRIVHLYESLGFSLQRVKAPRRISCNGDRTAADEVIATRGI
ncbi:MAG: DNA adenine methylase [Nitrosomonadaceae bacterium]|nr:DNA adenine methylase [Nitrosomonadaceae bacterium]